MVGSEAQGNRQGNKVLNQEDLFEILPFGKTKVCQLIKSGQLPLIKIGKDYFDYCS